MCVPHRVTSIPYRKGQQSEIKKNDSGTALKMSKLIPIYDKFNFVLEHVG